MLWRVRKLIMVCSALMAMLVHHCCFGHASCQEPAIISTKRCVRCGWSHWIRLQHVEHNNCAPFHAHTHTAPTNTKLLIVRNKLIQNAVCHTRGHQATFTYIHTYKYLHASCSCMSQSCLQHRFTFPPFHKTMILQLQVGILFKLFLVLSVVHLVRFLIGVLFRTHSSKLPTSLRSVAFKCCLFSGQQYC